MNVTFRNAAQADCTLLAQIGAETFFDTFAADNTPEDMAACLAESFSPAIQARELAHPANRFVILEVDGGQVPACIPGKRRMEIVRSNQCYHSGKLFFAHPVLEKELVCA